MREGNTKATLTLFNLEAEKTVQVIGENRIIISKNGLFEDKFDSWEVHLYRISK